MIHLVLMSGGSGSRLWPLSNDARSKQFLKVFSGSLGIARPYFAVADKLGACGAEMREFLSVSFGITSWRRVQTRNNATDKDDECQKFERPYVRNASFVMDARMVLKTLVIMLGKERKQR